MDALLAWLPLAEIANMGATELSMILATGCLIGLVLGMTGVGGGVLIIPILRIVFNMNPILAVGTASICASLMKVNAAALHIKIGNINWQQSLLMLAGALPATWFTTQAIVQLTNNPATSAAIENLVNYLVIGAILFSLASMIYKDIRPSKKDDCSTIQVSKAKTGAIKAVLAGIGSGCVIGATGVGGGVLLLPILTVLLNVDIKKAVGSSIFIALVLSTLSAFTYSGGGQADMVTAILLVAGSLVGVPLAGLLIKLISDKALHRMTLGLISISAAMLLGS